MGSSHTQSPDSEESVPAERKGPTPVILHVYDLGTSSKIKRLNQLFRPIGTGIFHVGVEVWGEEWSYGYCPDARAGIFSCAPKGCNCHTYRESVAMGDTELSDLEVKQLLTVLAKDWPGNAYDVTRKNCCHFGDELCRWLAVGAIPEWITSAAGSASKVGSVVSNVSEHARSLRSVVASLCRCRRRQRRTKEEPVPTPIPVALHIYDMGSTQWLNQITRPLGTGIYHCGVEINGKEWSFGESESGTGVFTCIPGRCEGHTYREAVDMGLCNLSNREITALMNAFVKEWQGQSYDILARNCCHFSDELCKSLGVGSVPSWVLSAAETAKVVADKTGLSNV